jgi:SAM-dependent methyltransferase
MLDNEYYVMRLAEDRYWWYILLRELIVASLSPALADRSAARILDAGCGTGGTMSTLKGLKRNWSVQGFDRSSLALEHCRDRGIGEVVFGSVDAIPFPDRSQDAVLSLDVLCCRGVDPDRAMEEFLRVLVPGGILLMNLPAFSLLRGQHDVAVACDRRYTPGGLRHLCERHGFTVRQLYCWNAWMFPVFLVWRPISLCLIRRPDEARSDLAPLPNWLNGLLLAIGRLDARLCRLIASPIGTSVLLVAVKRPA